MGKKKSDGAENPAPSTLNRISGYRTLARAGEARFIEKKSEFISHGAPVDSEGAARAFVDMSRRAHPQANHICYAYRIGADGAIQRMSDAGEPSGTAGVPILETIKARGLVNCAIAVARNFGGILLGTGGLARAYARACAIAIDACGVCVMEPTDLIDVTVPYPLWDIVRHALKDMPCVLSNVEYAADVKARIRVRSADAPAVLAKARDASNARVLIGESRTSLEAWDEI